RLDVRAEVDGFGKDDDVERAIERALAAQRFRGGSNESPVRHTLPGCCNLLRRDIDSRDIAVRKQRQKLAAAAPDFQNAGLWRDQMAVISREKRAVKTSKPRGFGRSRIVELANAIEVGTH